LFRETAVGIVTQVFLVATSSPDADRRSALPCFVSTSFSCVDGCPQFSDLWPIYVLVGRIVAFFRLRSLENRTIPLSILKWLMGVPVAQSIYVAAKIGIADALANGPKTCEDLGRSAGMDPAALYRVLRMLTSIGLFTESTGRCFNLTPMGRYLQSGQAGSLRDLAILIGESWHLQPWTDLLRTVRTGEPAFERWHGMSFFQHLSQNPEHALIFDRAMDIVARSSASTAATACDLERAKTVVDVGGGRGALLGSLLNRYPSLNGVLFDLPGVIAGVQHEFESQGLSGRCTSVPGDFLESVPSGGDVYFLSRVLHNWSDEHAVKILINCRKAMAPGGRILVVESLMGSAADFWGSWLDLEMLVNFGSRERRPEEYGELFQRAGLRMTKIVKADALSIFEAVIAE
jgi:hypothetical protein